MLVLLQNPIVNRLQIPVGHFQARPVRPVRPFLLTRLPSPLPHIWTVWPVANTVFYTIITAPGGKNRETVIGPLVL